MELSRALLSQLLERRRERLAVVGRPRDEAIVFGFPGGEDSIGIQERNVGHLTSSKGELVKRRCCIAIVFVIWDVRTSVTQYVLKPKQVEVLELAAVEGAMLWSRSAHRAGNGCNKRGLHQRRVHRKPELFLQLAHCRVERAVITANMPSA